MEALLRWSWTVWSTTYFARAFATRE